MKPQPDNEFSAFVGIDWADAKHDICLQPANSEQREFSVLPHRPEAIEVWASSLKQRFQGQPRRMPGTRQGPARLRAAEVRLPRAVSRQSDNTREIPVWSKNSNGLKRLKLSADAISQLGCVCRGP